MVDFLKYRKLSLFFFVVLFASVVGVYAYKATNNESAFTYSVEFTGGTQALLDFKQPVTVENINKILDSAGWDGAIVRAFSSKEILIRVKEYSNDPQGLAEKMRLILNDGLTENEAEIKSVDSVGPGIGADLRNSSIMAILIALFLMLLYVAVRFRSFAFAIGALSALFHDALIILATYLFFDFEISMSVVAAILLILGYSINDTIVIFSRIREVMGRIRNVPISEVVNISLNETLKRSIYTSVSTALVVLSLIIFGGPAIQTLSIPFLIGIVFGTYSSIFVASPVMLLFYNKK